VVPTVDALLLSTMLPFVVKELNEALLTVPVMSAATVFIVAFASAVTETSIELVSAELLPVTDRLLLDDVRSMVSALSVKTMLPSLAVVLTVEAELESVMLPVVDVAFNVPALAVPRMSAAALVMVAVSSAVALRLSALAASVLVPLTVRLLLDDVSETLTPLSVKAKLPSLAVVVTVVALVEAVRVPVPLD
jgi:hypothetical protein